MKSFRAIGPAKSLRFLFCTPFCSLLHWVVIPQVRTMLLRFAGAAIGRDTILLDAYFENVYHDGFRKLTIGNSCFIGNGVMLDVRGGITLEDHVTLSSRATIVSHINVGFSDHPLQKAYPSKEESVRIQRGAFIGTGAIILPGCTVGENSVVGAGAVVTKNVAPRTVVAGVPARVIKKVSECQGIRVSKSKP